MKKRNCRKPKNLIKKRNIQMNGNYYAREFQQLDRKGQPFKQQSATPKNKKAQSECINEYYKRIYEKYGTYLKNLSNPQETKRYQKPEFKKSETSNYMLANPIAVRNYRKNGKRYQCNTFGNV